ncbi:uncharacterized protein [Bemisia tabaci]|uniref:uncharacterized protein isoform X1 n=1 Tax=Bemisia tabaci TaxID=7038 RepID=UPI0008F98AD8|nr:PREDICTED: meiosis-specific nuclear structural protein 1-like isoform X1 [Bemisia tabaci]
MTDLLYQSPTSTTPRSDSFRCALLDVCRSPVLSRYSREDRANMGFSDLKHSRSDDLVLQSAPVNGPEMQHGISDAALQIQKDACVVYEDDVSNGSAKPAISSPSNSESGGAKYRDKSFLKLTGDFGNDVPNKRASQHVELYDKVDPEDSIRDIISENDFYRFVLFKRHYETYLDISRKYEEARNIAYYLEEKYHEIKAEKEILAAAHHELERRLEDREEELRDKEEELFLQLERVIRLEEDCEKLKQEKDKIIEWKERLQKERDEAYRQLKLQAEASEVTRRKLEVARNDVVRQVTAIVAEKDCLEKENSRLKEALQCLERKVPIQYRNPKPLSRCESAKGLEAEVHELKIMAKQSATLNSQLKKGMKHLASCRRRKCSVCAYTRATFGEYAAYVDDKDSKAVKSCFPFQDLRKWTHKPIAATPATEPDFSAQVAERLSQCSINPTSLAQAAMHLSYIDDCSLSSDCEGEGHEDCRASTTSSAPHAFSSDSGFSSELCDSGLQDKSFHRGSKWTSSFRKLFNRVSSKRIANTSNQS